MTFGTPKKDPGAMLGVVLPGYKKISEAPNDPNDMNLYKSINVLTGQVYLNRNPASLVFKDGEQGKRYLMRPQPIYQGMINDLIKIATPVGGRSSSMDDF